MSPLQRCLLPFLALPLIACEQQANFTAAEPGEALSAGTGRVKQRMITEPWDSGADGFGSANNEGPLGYAHLLTVDGARHEFDGLVFAHAPAPSRTRRSASLKIELRS